MISPSSWEHQKQDVQEILLGRDTIWNAPAIKKIRWLHPYCHFGASSEDEGWHSVVTEHVWYGETSSARARSSVASSNAASPSLRLASALWEPETEGQHEVADARLIAVADPIACLVTLAYRANNTTCSTGFLEEYFHGFFCETRHYERWLTQRPGLQLVIVGTGPEYLRQLRGAFQDTLRRMGEGAADLGVRWVEEHPRTAVLKGILAGHPPIAPWPRSRTPRAGWLEAQGESLAKNLEALTATLPLQRPIGSEASAEEWSPDDPWTWVYSVGARLSEIIPHEAGPDRHEDPPPSPQDNLEERLVSPMSLAALRLQVRRFQANPVAMVLAPVSLIASENASGKTTLVEGLCNLYLERARIRLALPQGADEWKDNERMGQGGDSTSSPGEPEPEVVALRLRDPTDPTDSERRAICCLFADDANLPAENSGETALAAWWHRREDSFKTLAAVVSALQQALNRCSRELERNVRAESNSQPRVEPAEPPSTPETSDSTGTPKRARSWRPGEFVRSVLTHSLSREEYRLRDARESESEDSERCEDERQTALRDLRINLGGSGLRDDLRQELLDQHVVVLPGDLRERLLQVEGTVPRSELPQLLPLFVAELHRAEHQSGLDPQAWDDLRGADQEFSGARDLRRCVAELAIIEVETAQRRLDRLSREIEHELMTPGVRGLEMRLYAFFDTAIEHFATDEVRANTARQIQRAQVARLARCLSGAAADLPLLVIDEPTLGMDGPSAARVMARYLRLRRSAESMRWARFFDREQIHLAGTERIVSDERGCILSLVRDSLRGVRESEPYAVQSSDAFRAGPAPPQIILTSYQTPALMAIADVEGARYDADLRRQLGRLIPREWWRQIVDAVLDAAKSFHRYARGERAWDWAPAEAARVFWPLKLDELPHLQSLRHDDSATGSSHYLDEAIAALQELGLLGLASEVDACRKEAKAKVDAAAKIEGNASNNKDEAWRKQVESIARRLLRWLLLTDLLPAAFADGPSHFVISGVSVRMFPAAGGEATEVGAARLRRITPFREILPSDPESWARGSTPNPTAREENGDMLAQRVPETSAFVCGPETPASASGDDPGKVVASKTHTASGVWRVRLVSTDKAAVSTAIRAAGMLVADTSIQDELPAVEVRGRLKDVDDGMYDWEIQPVLQIPGRTTCDTFTGTLDRLTTRLVDWRYSALSADPQAEDRVGITVATYQENQVCRHSSFQVSAVEPGTAQDSNRKATWREDIEMKIVRPLRRIQERLSRAPKTQQIRLHVQCLPGVAIRVGALFHHATGFSVDCDHYGEFWMLDRPRTQREVELLANSSPGQGSDEVHLLLSFAQSVRGAYDTWRASSREYEPRVALEIGPVEGPSRHSVSESDVVPIAEQIVRSVLAVRGPAKKLRIFCAMPNSLAVALGRELNALGQIATMDFDKQSETYFETNTF